MCPDFQDIKFYLPLQEVGQSCTPEDKRGLFSLARFGPVAENKL